MGEGGWKRQRAARVSESGSLTPHVDTSGGAQIQKEEGNIREDGGGAAAEFNLNRRTCSRSFVSRLKFPSSQLDEDIQSVIRARDLSAGPGPVPLTGPASITKTAPLFCPCGKNKRRALLRVLEAHLTESGGSGPIPRHM